ncbi:MAG TPA: hypothetical protein VGB96_15615, partial [Archangium sp.]
EESLVSASTQVLSRDPLPPRSTLPLPSAPEARNSRPMPVVSPAEQGRTPEPAALEPVPAPVPVAQVMPAGASAQEARKPKRGGKGLWVGASMAAVILIGGVAALVAPSKPPAPEAQASAPVTPAPGNAPVPATPPAQIAASSPTSEPALAGAPDAGSPDAGAVAAVTPPSAPAPAAAGTPGQTPAEQAPVVEAKGTLTVKAVPYADVYVDGKLVRRELQGTANIPLAPGSYRLTFKHPSRTDSSEVTITPNGRVTKAFTATRK